MHSIIPLRKTPVTSTKNCALASNFRPQRRRVRKFISDNYLVGPVCIAAEAATAVATNIPAPTPAPTPAPLVWDT